MTPGAYPLNWDDIATGIKRAADWNCIRCRHEHDAAAGYCLTVHHLDRDKSNCRWWNLVALCQRCHLSIQGRVIMERYFLFEHSTWFKPYAAGYYAFHNGRRDDREYVMANLGELLSLGGPV